MSVGTQTHVSVSFGSVLARPMPRWSTLLADLDHLTWEGWLALPEHDGATCFTCGLPGLNRHGVWACSACGSLWRWPGAMGMD